jgi:hypothetical protein
MSFFICMYGDAFSCFPCGPFEVSLHDEVRAIFILVMVVYLYLHIIQLLRTF